MYSSERRAFPIVPCMLCMALGAAVLAGSSIRADVFVLKNGRHVEGELLNPNQSPRRSYEIRLKENATITLDADQVRRVESNSPEEREYGAILPRMPRTAEGNWVMSRWCRQKRLSQLEQFHLEEVIRLDPNHEEARRRLGFQLRDGRWVKPEEIRREARAEQGLRRYKGKWRTEQDIQLMRQREQREAKLVQWRKDVRRWRKWLEGRRSAAALQNFAAIRDAAAAVIINEELAEEENANVRSLYYEVLGRIGGPDAIDGLVIGSLRDPDRDLRYKCLDQLDKFKGNQLARRYLGALRGNDIQQINRAAIALKDFGNRTSIPYLIDALTTTLRVKIGGNQGRTAAAFSRAPGATNGFGNLGGLSVNAKPRIVERTYNNQEVLNTLVSLAENVNYRFNKAAWKQWYSDSRVPDKVHIRRIY